jgi:hypothetical protein
MTMQLKAGQVGAAVAAVLLWLTTTAGAVAGIYFIRQAFMWFFLMFGGELKSAEAIAQWMVVALGVLGLIFVIGTAEYHLRHFGRPASWKLFGWSLAVEAALAALYYALVAI